ncbi:unnamed protein product [Echinostoma caproni]|uniref:Uncharacterized protein n=1 Tax=Echinostoma caproni TaxID=27848 RepID=A0A183AQ54_9TREM|nr:unnamed protein product [Echinostoma caproni]
MFLYKPSGSSRWGIRRRILAQFAAKRKAQLEDIFVINLVGIDQSRSISRNSMSIDASTPTGDDAAKIELDITPRLLRIILVPELVGLGSTPTMDALAPAMFVGRRCLHCFDYMCSHSGPG